LQNQEIERKLICSNADCSNAVYSCIMFCSSSCFMKTCQLKYMHVCMCLCIILITVGVTLDLWHWGKTVDWVWDECFSVLIILWLNWRKLYFVQLHKLYSFLNFSHKILRTEKHCSQTQSTVFPQCHRSSVTPTVMKIIHKHIHTCKYFNGSFHNAGRRAKHHAAVVSITAVSITAN
jgi:hypothetical protein